MIEIIETVNNGLEDCYKCYDPEFQIYEKTTGYYYNAPDVNYYIYLPVRRFNELEESNIPVEPVEPVVEKIIHISFDGGETYENCLLCDLVADEIDWETAITKGLTIDGNAVSVADDNVIYCDRLLKYAKGDLVNKYDIIELDGWYVLE